MSLTRLDALPTRAVLTRWAIPMGLFLLALAVRLPGLGQFLTPDEFLWADRSRNFLAGLLNPDYVCESPTNQTGFQRAVGLACMLRTGHPGVTTMWTGSIGILLRYLADGAPDTLFDYTLAVRTNPLDPRFIAPLRLPTAVLTSLWVVAVYWLVWRLFADRRVALAAGLLLTLDPFHAAFSRVIHHDALSTTFMTLSLLTALIYWGQRESRRWLVASGFLAGLAFLSKSPALFLNLFIALIGLWSLARRRTQGEALSWRHVATTVGDGLLWFGCAAATFVALWPAMWVIPLDTLRNIFFVGSQYASGGHAKGNYFLGSVSKDPGVLFYPVTWLLRSSPLVWVGLIALAAKSAKRRINKSESQQVNGSIRQQGDRPTKGNFLVSPIASLLLFAVLFVIFMTVGEKKQDRYVLPVYPVLSIVAAAGLLQISKFKSSVFSLRSLIFPLILLFQGVLVLANYPYYLTYYNPLLGGIRGAERLVTIGWGEGMDRAAAYLNQKPNAEQLRVASWYQSTFAPFFKGEAISYSDQKGKAMAGEYVVFYINQVQRRFPDEEIFHYFETRYQPEKIIPLKGVDYAVIYPGPHIQHYVEDRVDENRRKYEGIAALLGWDWPGAANPNRPVVTVGDALPLWLYWEFLGMVPEERFFARLIGADGRVWAEGISQPVLSENGDPTTWRQGQIITEAGELPVPVGTPPGEYKLQIGFYTQAPAVTEGELVFELPTEEAWVEVMPSAQPEDVEDLPLSLQQDDRLAELQLLGIAARDMPRLRAERPWSVDVYWQAKETPPIDYRARLSLVDDDNQTRWVWKALPPVSFYPTSLWQTGQVIRSQMTVTPTLRTPAGQFNLALTLLNEEGKPVGQTELGRVQVQGRVRSFDLPSIETRMDAIFGDVIELVGFDVQSPAGLASVGPNLQAGDEIAVALIWRARAAVQADYTVTVQLVGSDGGVYGQRDAQPLDGAAPTSTWTPGEVLTDVYRFRVADDASPGRYRLLAGIYRLETGERLPVVDDRGQPVDDKVFLATVEVIP